MANNNSKKRVNLIDLIVLIAIVAIVIFLGYNVLFGNSDGDKNVVNSNVTYVIETKMMDEDVLSYIKEGQNIYDGATKNELGKIVSIRKTPALVMVENHDAKTIEQVEHPEKVDLLIEVETKAKMEYPNIIVDEISLKIGKQVHCVIGDAALSGTIIGMDYDASLLTKKEEKK